MSHSDRLRFAILALLGVVLLSLHDRGRCSADTGQVPGSQAESPIPIRRILLNPERLPQELERLKQGTLVQLSRTEFEDRLRQASEAVQAQKNPPRLTESRYQAVLADSALVGIGEWHILHLANQPALMPLPSFNLSLRRQVTGEVEDHPSAAAVGESGKIPALLLAEAGTHRVDLEWSLRGDTRPDGLHFELKIPSSPIATLELYLPGGWQVSLPEGGLVTGPQPLPREGSPAREVLPTALHTLIQAEKPLAPSVPAGSRLWTIHLGGVSRLPLVLRPSDRPGPARFVVQRHQSTQTLYPDALEAKYELDLEVQTRSVSELICECDPGLRPYAVSLANLDSWEVRRGPNPESPSLLVLKLKEPIHEGSLRVSCLAPLRTVATGGPPVGPKSGTGPTGEPPVATASPQGSFPWTSPGLRLQGGVPRGETLFLRLHPELRLTSWNSGSFRLIETLTEPETDQKISWQRLKLIGGGLTQPGKPLLRPTARLQAHALEYRARQLAWWQPGPTRSALTLQIQYEASVGQLFDLPVQLPAGWEIDRVEMSPPGLLGSWRLRRDRSLLLVELQKPLCPQDSPSRGGLATRTGTLTVGLTAPGVKLQGAGRKAIAFPDAIALGARFREGALALSIDPAFQAAELRTTLTSTQPQEEGPWKSQLPGSYFPYREQAPQGTLVLQRRPVQLRASATTDVLLSAGPLALETQVEIEVEAGTTESLEVRASTDSSGRWDWRSLTPGIHLVRAERLSEPEMAAGLLGLLAPVSRFGPLLAASRLPLVSPGPGWRLTFSRPLRPQDRLVLQVSTTFDAARSASLYRVPLLQVPWARRLEGEVRLRLARSDRFDVRAAGLQEVSAPASPLQDGRPIWRVFRLGPAPASLDLVRFLPESGEEVSTSRGVLSRAQLLSSLGPDGVLQHQFRFSLTGWTEAHLPVRLPPGARLLTASVDGRWLEQLPTGEPPAGEPLQLPVPLPPSGSEGDGRSQWFEITDLTDVSP